MDEHLLSGFMTAIDQFAQALGVGEISSLALHESRFTFAKNEKFLFILRSTNETKERFLKDNLRKIQDIFFKTIQLTRLKGIRDLDSKLLLDKEYDAFFADSLEKLKISLWY